MKMYKKKIIIFLWNMEMEMRQAEFGPSTKVTLPERLKCTPLSGNL